MLSRDNGRALYICILKEMKNIKMKRKKKKRKRRTYSKPDQNTSGETLNYV